MAKETKHATLEVDERMGGHDRIRELEGFRVGDRDAAFGIGLAAAARGFAYSLGEKLPEIWGFVGGLVWAWVGNAKD